jgi:hypothetical protein
MTLSVMGLDTASQIVILSSIINITLGCKVLTSEKHSSLLGSFAS